MTDHRRLPPLDETPVRQPVIASRRDPQAGQIVGYVTLGKTIAEVIDGSFPNRPWTRQLGAPGAFYVRKPDRDMDGRDTDHVAGRLVLAINDKLIERAGGPKALTSPLPARYLDGDPYNCLVANLEHGGRGRRGDAWLTQQAVEVRVVSFLDGLDPERAKQAASDGYEAWQRAELARFLTGSATTDVAPEWLAGFTAITGASLPLGADEAAKLAANLSLNKLKRAWKLKPRPDIGRSDRAAIIGAAMTKLRAEAALAEAARVLDVSPETLEGWRQHGSGQRLDSPEGAGQ